MAKARPYARKKASKLTSISAWHDFARNRLAFLIIAIIFGFGIIAYFGSGPGGGGSGVDRAAREQEAVVVVNGEPVTRAEVEREVEGANRSFAAMGPAESARMQGGMLAQLVDNALRVSVAKKRGLSVSDNYIDEHIAKTKVSMGEKDKPLSDDQLEEVLTERLGMTLTTFRERLRVALLPNVLEDSIASKIKVTEEDLLKSYDQIKVRHILIATPDSPRPSKDALPDAQAKRRAEMILAKIRAGEKFETLADQYTMDPTNKTTEPDPKTKKVVTKTKGGSLAAAGQDGWYQRGGGFAKEFEDAAFALKKGEVSGVVKTPFGYHIIKVDDVRRNLPPDYAKNKPELLSNLKKERARQPMTELFDAEKKKAKVEWKEPRYKWRYDYARLNPMFGGTSGQDAPNPETFAKELQAYTTKNPDDAAANLVLGQQLFQQYMMAGIQMPGQRQPTPKPDRDKLRAEIIKAYENALKNSEDRPTRFALAQLYEEGGQKDKALKQYNQIKRLLSYDESPETKFAHEQLQRAYKKLGETALANEEAKKVAELTAQEKERQRKEAAEAKQKAAEEAKQKAAEVKTNPATGTSATAPALLPDAKSVSDKSSSAPKPK
jgi:parvulin-like peptidyl-prolyl isomerase